MLIAQVGNSTRRRPPIPGGPIAEALVPADGSDRVAVIHVEVPAGGGMPEHDHGASQIVLIQETGSVEVGHDGKSETLSAGAVAYIAKGERVSITNPGTETATLMVVASPADFAAQLANWPTA